MAFTQNGARRLLKELGITLAINKTHLNVSSVNEFHCKRSKDTQQIAITMPNDMDGSLVLPIYLNATMRNVHIEYIPMNKRFSYELPSYISLNSYKAMLNLKIQNHENLSEYRNSMKNQCISLRVASINTQKESYSLSTSVTIKNNASVVGVVQNKNTHTITEDSFILSSGVVINKNIMSTYLNSQAIKTYYKQINTTQAIEAILLAKKDLLMLTDEAKYHSMGYYGQVNDEDQYHLIHLAEKLSSKILEECVDLIDVFIREHNLGASLIIRKLSNQGLNTLERIHESLKSSHLKKKKALEDGVNERILTIINEFKSYQTDLVKMMERPILSDLSDEKVKIFNLEIKKILAAEESSMSLVALETEWEALQSYADKLNTSHFSDKQNQKLKDSKVLLDKAINDGSTQNEKELSVKALTNNLNGILPLNDEVFLWLSNITGIKEIGK